MYTCCLLRCDLLTNNCLVTNYLLSLSPIALCPIAFDRWNSLVICDPKRIGSQETQTLLYRHSQGPFGTSGARGECRSVLSTNRNYSRSLSIVDQTKLLYLYHIVTFFSPFSPLSPFFTLIHPHNTIIIT